MEDKNSAIKNIARFVVDKRRAFYLLFIIMALFCINSISKVQVNNDIVSYLPNDTETKRGLDIMENEFITYGSAQIMVTNITYASADEIKEYIEQTQGVAGVSFDNTEAHYKDSAAIYTIQFKGGTYDKISETAMANIKAYLSGYDYYVSSSVGQDYTKILNEEMSQILLVASLVILAVLLLTSRSYAEIPIFLVVFVVAALLNMGTNYWFDEISFVTNSIAVVLQLALAVDYSIILCHRFMDELEIHAPREAAINALSKAIVEISASSLTTIAGLMALTLMHFRLGFDMGIVLTKGIVCSMITVFLLMPGLLMLFSKAIIKTRHRSFVPRITAWGKLIVKLRYVLPALFVVVVGFAIVFSGKSDFVFSDENIDTANPSISRIASDKIEGTFGKSNTIAVLVPTERYEDQRRLIEEVEALDCVKSAMGLANIKIDDQHMLADRLTPRQFAELADIEIEMSRLLFQAYGISVEEYTPIFQNVDEYTVPLIEIFPFLCAQKDAGVISLNEEQSKTIDELRETLEMAVNQLESENWSRLVFTANLPIEGQQTDDFQDEIRQIALTYFDDVILVGNSTSARDLKNSFQSDNRRITLLTILFVLLILLFTFQSGGLPVLLVMTIQGSIWINFSFPYITGNNLFFIAYLIISAIQMGATIDYAIVITNRYLELKQTMDKKLAVIETLNQSFATVFTSGAMLTSAGFIIAGLTTEPIISSIGQALGRGTLISIILVMTVLPQFLLLGDIIIEKTSFKIKSNRPQQKASGTMWLDGHVKGHVSGYVDANIKGLVRGEIDVQLAQQNEAPVEPPNKSNEQEGINHEAE
ncbi:MMPL family transporter [Eubacteriales bacterium OttesenSCG-928-K08]|nr:MMPL family transporter [Eubacteriales bacterium OttesenSCG-928-K08]